MSLDNSSEHKVPDDGHVLKVRGSSNAQSVASAVAHAVYGGGEPVMRAIGAGAVNQAVKAGTIAAGFCAPRGIALVFRLGFEDIIGDSGDKISCITIKAIRG